MHVGYAPVFQNLDHRLTDTEVYRQEIRLAHLAEPLGYQSIWTTEHHFTDYEMIPEPTQFLSYMAGCTNNMLLGSMVIVVPWHDPLRVAEQVSLLDNISGGRMILGMGRGLGRREFEGFRVPMEESRDRFDLYSRAIVDGLERGYVEYSSEFGNQSRQYIRPFPFKSFRGRTYTASISPESLPVAAQLGAGLLIIPQKRWEETQADLDTYRELFPKFNPGLTMPNPVVVGFCILDEDPIKAKDLAQEHIHRYYASVSDHYEMDGDHFAKTKGYGYYANHGWVQGGVSKKPTTSAADTLLEGQPWGTPAQVIEKLEHIRGLLDNNALITHFSFGGISYEAAEKSMRLFASEVLPVLKSWKVAPFGQAADLPDLRAQLD